MSRDAADARAARGGRRGAPSSAAGRPGALDVERILRWADAHRTATGRWPDRRSGPAGGAGGEAWSAIDTALRHGRRGLPGGSSLAQLLAEERGVTEGANPESPLVRLRAWEAEQFPSRRPRRRPAARPRATTRLRIDLILSWADAHRAATGQWPRIVSGPVRDHPALNWRQVDRALTMGYRGLPGGTTLADLLQEERGVRNKQNLPRLDVEQILAWADAHREATGEFPHGESGPVRAAPGETWAGIQSALSNSLRGLPGGSSLAQLLAERRGYRGPLSAERILAWADAHHAATGRWPTAWSSGPVRGAPGETWPSLDDSLRAGRRGLPGGTTLAQLLAEYRQAPNIYTEPPLSAEQILTWAEAHRAAGGRWPSPRSGPVLHAEGEHWGSIDTALRDGYRGLPGGQSLGRLIRGHGGPDVYLTRPKLTVEEVLAWADAHREATGEWPIEESGPVGAAPGETWKAISLALLRGDRGLPGGSSLARLLAEFRGARNPRDLPRLTVEQVLAWADAHRVATGRWPSSLSGPVAEGSEETWAVVNAALFTGRRGLPGGSSIARLLAKCRPVRPRRLSLRKIHAWARAHREATGRWPDGYAGPVRGVPDEIWSAVDAALKFGRRGLPGGSSLTTLFGRSLDPAALGIRPGLTVEQVLAWADSHRAATGRWPTIASGPVDGVPGEKWVNVDAALRHGRRGLPRGTTLTRLIAEHRGAPAPTAAAAPRSLGGQNAPAAPGVRGAAGRP
jgi:hypothetical protein